MHLRRRPCSCVGLNDLRETFLCENIVLIMTILLAKCFIKLHVLKEYVYTVSGRVTYLAPKCGSGRVGLFVGRVESGLINLTYIHSATTTTTTTTF